MKANAEYERDSFERREEHEEEEGEILVREAGEC